MSRKVKCRLCDSEFETQYLQVNGRKLYVCADCLLLIFGVVKDSMPTVLEEALGGMKRTIPKWQMAA